MPAGRPKAKYKMENIVVVRLYRSEMELLRKAANADRRPVSAYVRNMVLDRIQAEAK